jgi:glycosyltransferase involved in cell wall biosynthesis
MRRLTVLLLVNDLRIGGAERQLVELARGLDKERFRVIVATLYAGQPFENDVRDCPGVELLSLNRLGKFDFVTLFKLVRLLRREKVDIIQPFLTPATAFGMLAAIIARTPVKFVTERCGVRINTDIGDKLYRFFEDRLTRFADAVVPNSEAGRRYVRSRGIAREKVRVIYNGVAPERVNATLAERQAIRADYGVLDESWLIGIVASLTPAKDHASFLQAASIVRAEVPGTKFPARRRRPSARRADAARSRPRPEWQRHLRRPSDARPPLHQRDGRRRALLLRPRRMLELPARGDGPRPPDRGNRRRR